MEGRTSVITVADSGIRCHDYEKYRAKKKVNAHPKGKAEKINITIHHFSNPYKVLKYMQLYAYVCVSAALSSLRLTLAIVS